MSLTVRKLLVRVAVPVLIVAALLSSASAVLAQQPEPAAAGQAAAAEAGAGGEANLVIPDLSTVEFHGVNGKTLLMGGLKGYFGPEANAHNGAVVEAKAETKPQNVLLLVKPTLIIQREVEKPQFPLLKERKKDPQGNPH